MSALDYCHKLKIVHRDLKPENLLFGADRSIKVADFGLANTYSEGALLKTHCGSPSYCAPELVEGRECMMSMYVLSYLDAGPPADLWSLGIVLYVLVGGCLPFGGDTIGEMFQRISTVTFRMLDHFSTGMVLRSV